MQGRQFLLVMLLAFGCSLLAGKFMFQHPAENSPVLDTANAAPDYDLVAPAENFETPVVHAEELPPAMQYLAPAPYAQGATLNRDLKATDFGVENRNTRMASVFNANYSEGVMHSAPAGRKETVRWIPGRKELRNGQEVVHSYGEQSAGKGKVETVEGNTRFLYEDSFPYVDERFYVREDGGVEHDYIVKREPEAMDRAEMLVFTGKLQMGRGLSLYEGEKKIEGHHVTTEALDIKNPLGHSIFRLRKPYAFDAKVANADGSLNIDQQSEDPYRLTACQYIIDVLEDGSVELAVATPTSWLADESRVWPVTVDPNIGPGGLSDAIFNGGVPIYTGAVGGNPVLPIHATTGARLNFTNVCPAKPDDGAIIIPLPFFFIYYGVPVGPGTLCPNIEIHINGYVQFIGLACPFASAPIIGCPPLCSPLEFTNVPIPNANCPNMAIFGYWDDLKFGSNPESGVYVATIGQPGNRQFIIEWFKMGYVDGANNEEVSFNIILHECGNLIEIRLLNGNDLTPTTNDEVDRGEASIGIEDPSGTIGIQFDFNSITAGPPNDSGQPTPLDPITAGTAVTFTPALGANLAVTVNGQAVMAGDVINPQQCVPVRACFSAIVTPPVINCGGLGGPAVTPSFGFQWTLTLPDQVSGLPNTIFFKSTPNFCQTFAIPGVYTVTLTVLDSLGVPSIFGPFSFLACDFPRVVLGADPQGGTAPLEVNFFTDSSIRLPSSTITDIIADDVNVVPVGTTGLAAGDVIVQASPTPTAGDLLETVPQGDDFLNTSVDPPTIVDGGNGIAETTANNGAQAIISPGPNGILDSTPAGDDVIVGTAIVDGGNGTADSTAVGDDIQITPVGGAVLGSGNPIWLIELMTENNLGTPPGFYATMPAGVSRPTFTFTQDGLYKVTVTWAGLDMVTNTPTQMSKSIFIFVELPNTPIDDNLLIEKASYKIDWKGKADGPDPDNLADDPNNDTMSMSGTFSMPPISTSDLQAASLFVDLIVNGTEQIVGVGDGPLDAKGRLTVKNFNNKVHSKFSLKLPSGKFSASGYQRRLDTVLGVDNRNEDILLPCHIQLNVWDLSDPLNPVRIYPFDVGAEPEPRGAIITFDHHSTANRFAFGRYQMGKFTNEGIFVQNGNVLGNTSLQQVMVSGVFLVKKAKFKIKGGSVTCDVSGVLSRFGGDDLRPQSTTDVTVRIGPAVEVGGASLLPGFTETVNFATDPTWKVKGPNKRETITYKRHKLSPGSLKSIQWTNQFGNFRFRTEAVDNVGMVGLDLNSPTGEMVMPVQFTIVHENDTGAGVQAFDATSEFMVYRKGSGYSR